MPVSTTSDSPTTARAAQGRTSLTVLTNDSDPRTHPTALSPRPGESRSSTAAGCPPGVGVPSFGDQPVDRVITTSRPGPGQVLVDVQDAGRGIYRGTIGDTVRLQAGNGTVRTLTVSGSGRSMALGQDTRTGHLILYATQATVQELGGFHGVNFLEFRLRDASQPAAHATAAAGRSFLAAHQNRTAFAGLPVIRTPGDWPGKGTFDRKARCWSS